MCQCARGPREGRGDKGKCSPSQGDRSQGNCFLFDIFLQKLYLSSFQNNSSHYEPITKVSPDAKSPFWSPHNYQFIVIHIGKFAAVSTLLINSPTERREGIPQWGNPGEGQWAGSSAKFQGWGPAETTRGSFGCNPIHSVRPRPGGAVPLSLDGDQHCGAETASLGEHRASWDPQTRKIIFNIIFN